LQNGKERLRNVYILDSSAALCPWLDSSAAWIKSQFNDVLLCISAFYGTDTWTLQKTDEKYLASFEMWRRTRM